MKDEFILSIKKKDVEETPILSRIFNEDDKGALRLNSVVVLNILKEIGSRTSYERRISIEDNPKILQIIPYIYIKNKGRYFSSERTDAGGDSRLFGFKNLGFGGHCNSMASDFNTSLLSNVYRELDEELEDLVHKPITISNFRGFIYDNSNSVGQVHLGLVVEVEALTENIKLGEKSHKKGKFVTIEEAVEKLDNYENWSKILINSFLNE